jgi:hypothetical protein
MHHGGTEVTEAKLVVPAKAGTQNKRRAVTLDPGFSRGDDDLLRVLRASVVKTKET